MRKRICLGLLVGCLMSAASPMASADDAVTLLTAPVPVGNQIGAKATCREVTEVLTGEQTTSSVSTSDDENRLEGNATVIRVNTRSADGQKGGLTIWLGANGVEKVSFDGTGDGPISREKQIELDVAERLIRSAGNSPVLGQQDRLFQENPAVIIGQSALKGLPVREDGVMPDLSTVKAVSNEIRVRGQVVEDGLPYLLVAGTAQAAIGALMVDFGYRGKIDPISGFILENQEVITFRAMEKLASRVTIKQTCKIFLAATKL